MDRVYRTRIVMAVDDPCLIADRWQTWLSECDLFFRILSFLSAIMESIYRLSHHSLTISLWRKANGWQKNRTQKNREHEILWPKRTEKGEKQLYHGSWPSLLIRNDRSRSIRCGQSPVILIKRIRSQFFSCPFVSSGDHGFHLPARELMAVSLSNL